MLKTLRRLSGRPHRLARIAYLRWRIGQAEDDACAIQADMLTGPQRLTSTRAFITHLASRIAALEKS